MCLLCHPEALNGIQIEDTPALLVAGTIAAAVCVARKGKSTEKKEETEIHTEHTRIHRNGRYDRSREKRWQR